MLGREQDFFIYFIHSFINKQTLYEHIKQETFRHALQLHFSVMRESNECGNGTVLLVCALQYMHKGAGACIICIISYKIAKETTSTQCRDQ